MRFGIFDFDPNSRELRRDGVPVKLQAQPAQVLSLLVAHGGEIVSREILRQAIWGDETFVDFDRGLNFCVAQIRAALGDTASSPRFIRTIPKQGYQFIAPVAVALLSERPLPVERLLPVERPSRRRWWLAAIPVACCVWGWKRLLPKPPFRVAVVRFDNVTGDPNIDRQADSLTDAFVAELAANASGRYEVIGNALILREQRPRRDLLAIGSSLNAGYVVLGQVLHDAGRTIVVASLIAVPEQTHVRVARLEFGPGKFPRQQESAKTMAAILAAPLAAGQRSRSASPPAVKY